MDEFEDARMLLARARMHFQEFSETLGRNGQRPLWHVNIERQLVGCNLTLNLNREVLKSVKPIIADASNNLVHSLDQAIGAVARLRGYERLKGIYFPWIFSDTAFQKALRQIQNVIGEETATVINNVRCKYIDALPHIQTIKEVSNSGKHWSLIPQNTSVMALAINAAGKQQIFDLPPDAFAESDTVQVAAGIEVPRGAEIAMVLKVEFSGLGEGLPASPDNVFHWGFRFAEEMLDALANIEARSEHSDATAAR